jgi:hypothetical protein
MKENNRKEYKAAWWQEHRKNNKRVYGTLTPEEYNKINNIAELNSRSVWSQIWQQSCAYQNNRFLPSKDIEKQILLIKTSLRKIGCNINQISKHSNVFKKLSFKKDLEHQIFLLEQVMADFVTRPWIKPKNTPEIKRKKRS